MPGDPVTMRVQGEKGSCVCVAAVDKSLYLLKPDFQLSPEKVGSSYCYILNSVMFLSYTGCRVAPLLLYPTSHRICFLPSQIFKELADFDVSDAFGIPKDDGHFWWPGLSSRRRKRSSVFPWHWDITKDARFAFTVSTHSIPEPAATSRQRQVRKKKDMFLGCVCFCFSACLTQETGLIVMTDMVSLNHRQSGGMYTDEAVPAFQPHTSTLVAAVHSRPTAR